MAIMNGLSQHLRKRVDISSDQTKYKSSQLHGDLSQRWGPPTGKDLRTGYGANNLHDLASLPPLASWHLLNFKLSAEKLKHI